MATFDVLARISLQEGTDDTTVFRREDTDTTFTEYTKQTHIIPDAASDQAIDLGGVATSSILLIETTSDQELTFKINGTGNTPYNVSNGFVILYGVDVTSLHVSNASGEAITMRVLAIS